MWVLPNSVEHNTLRLLTRQESNLSLRSYVCTSRTMPCRWEGTQSLWTVYLFPHWPRKKWKASHYFSRHCWFTEGERLIWLFFLPHYFKGLHKVTVYLFLQVVICFPLIFFKHPGALWLPFFFAPRLDERSFESTIQVRSIYQCVIIRMNDLFPNVDGQAGFRVEGVFSPANYRGKKSPVLRGLQRRAC